MPEKYLIIFYQTETTCALLLPSVLNVERHIAIINQHHPSVKSLVISAAFTLECHAYSMKLIYNVLIQSMLDYDTFFWEPENVNVLKKIDTIIKYKKKNTNNRTKGLRIITF